MGQLSCTKPGKEFQAKHPTQSLSNTPESGWSPAHTHGRAAAAPGRFSHPGWRAQHPLSPQIGPWEAESVFTLPPPGWCLRLSVEPILDLTFFRSGMGAADGWMRVLAEAGDFGGVRTTATFLGSLAGGVGREGVRERLPGVPGEPGLL